MTDSERDKLAKWLGWTPNYNIMDEAWYYEHANQRKCWSVDTWKPDTSRDHCQPLLEEVERRKLWDRFTDAVAIVHSRRAGWYAAYWLLYLTPADIVAACLKLAEEKR